MEYEWKRDNIHLHCISESDQSGNKIFKSIILYNGTLISFVEYH